MWSFSSGCAENVILVWLPAYSPELNPVERLWEDLKRRIAVLNGQVRSSLSALQEHVADLVPRYSAETIASLTGYAYLVDAIHALQF
jgi:DDE superfamily endonuclease